MTTSTNNPAVTAAGTAFHTFLSDILFDLVGSGSNILGTSLKSISANPSIENILAQQAAVAIAAPLALPTLESTVAKQGADIGLALLTQLQALVPTPAAS